MWVFVPALMPGSGCLVIIAIMIIIGAFINFHFIEPWKAFYANNFTIDNTIREEISEKALKEINPYLLDTIPCSEYGEVYEHSKKRDKFIVNVDGQEYLCEVELSAEYVSFIPESNFSAKYNIIRTRGNNAEIGKSVRIKAYDYSDITEEDHQLVADVEYSAIPQDDGSYELRDMDVLKEKVENAKEIERKSRRDYKERIRVDNAMKEVEKIKHVE